MRLYVHHRIDYSFSEPQARLVQLLRLAPLSHAGQNVVDWRIDVDCDARIKGGRDGFGNETGMLYVEGPIQQLTLTTSGEVITDDRAGMVDGTVETLPPLFYLQSTEITQPTPALAAFAAGIGADEMPLTRAHLLKDALHDRLGVDTSGFAPLTDAGTAFARSACSYQDAGQVMVAAARAIGIPARYVSGLVLRPDDIDHAAHGWAELHIDGYGWIAFDPTHGHCPDHRYLRVAAGLDRRDAAPVSGTRTGGGSEHLSIVARVAERQLQD